MRDRGKRGGGEAHLPFFALSSESVLWILRTHSADTPYPFSRYNVSAAVDTLCGLAPFQPCTVAASEQRKPRATPSNSEQLAATRSNSQQRSADQPFHPLLVGGTYPIFPDGFFDVLPPEVCTAAPARFKVIPYLPLITASAAAEVQRVRLPSPSPQRRRTDAQPSNLFLRCSMAPERQNPRRVLIDHALAAAPFAPHPSVAGRLRFAAVLTAPRLPTAEPVALPSRQVTHAVLDPLHRIASSGEQVSPFSGDAAILHGERRFPIPLGSHALFFSSSLSKKIPSLPVQSSQFPDTRLRRLDTLVIPSLYAPRPKILREIF